jgi:hypothetical protein
MANVVFRLHPITFLPIGSGYFSNQTFPHINTPTFSTPVILHTYTHEDTTDCPEMLAHKLQTPVNNEEENVRQPCIHLTQGVTGPDNMLHNTGG